MSNLAEDRPDPIEIIVEKAHEICSVMLLYEAISMEIKKIRTILGHHDITDINTQNRYLKLVEKYDMETGNMNLSLG